MMNPEKMKRAMGCSTKCLMILLGCNLLCCDAAVTVSLINSANGVNTIECRSDGVVSCRINPYAGLITWVINGTLYATCAPACSENPSFTRNYTPAYDTANGVFNLTVGSATFNDNDTTFKCDDGAVSDDITVEVVPAYSEFKTSISNTDGGKQVEFTTACVQPGVEFEWFTVKTDNSDRKTYNTGQNETTKTSECPLDSDCGGFGTVKFASVIMISTVPTFPKGNFEEKRYIEVVVKYKNPDEERTFRFDETFLFIVPYCGFHCGLIILTIYGGRWFLLLVLYIAAFFCSAFYQKCMRKNKRVLGSYCPICGTFYTVYLLLNLREGAWQSPFPFPLEKKQAEKSNRTCDESSDKNVCMSSSGTKISCAETEAPAQTTKRTVDKTSDKEVCPAPPSSSGTKRPSSEPEALGDTSKRTVEVTSNKDVCPKPPSSSDEPSKRTVDETSNKDVCPAPPSSTGTKTTRSEPVALGDTSTKTVDETSNNDVCPAPQSSSGDTSKRTVDETFNKDVFSAPQSSSGTKTTCSEPVALAVNKRTVDETSNKDVSTAPPSSSGTKRPCAPKDKKSTVVETSGKDVVSTAMPSSSGSKRPCAPELYSGKSRALFIVCCILDIALLAVMILTCTHKLEVSCYIYGVYGCCGLVVSLMYIVCLAKCLHKDKCKCSLSRNKSELYCLSCQQYLCPLCFTNHAEYNILRHSQQGADETRVKISCDLCNKKFIPKIAKYYNSGDEKFVCEGCKPDRGLKEIIAIDDYFFHSEVNVESYCLSCHQYLCPTCVTKHDECNILHVRHSQQEKGECQIFCNMCEKNAFNTAVKCCNSDDKNFVCEDCKSKRDQKDIVAKIDMYFHSEISVDSYCLSCQQYMCPLCFTKHDKCNILRHSQQDAGKKRCHIFCKFCLKQDKRSDAKYYCKEEKIFVCEDCKSGNDLNDIIAVEDIRLEELDQKWECEEGCKNNPVECYCMINKKNMCAACFIKKGQHSLMKQKPIETRRSEHTNFCALHSVAGLPANKNAPLNKNAANESSADVLCLVCNEFLCKMCFNQHLDPKQLWLNQYSDERNSRIKILLNRPVMKRAEKENEHDVEEA